MPYGLITFANDDEFYFVNSGEHSQPTSPVWCWDGSEGYALRYQSLTALMLTIAEGYETGALSLSSSGYYTEDITRSEVIFNQYNPGLEFIGLLP